MPRIYMLIKQLLFITLNIIFLCGSIVPTPLRAEGLSFLPAPGVMVNLSPAHEPVLIKGLKVHPDNPFLFDFILDNGNSALAIDSPAFMVESQKLIKYFLSALTVPEKDLWVNLSPYEKDRMIPANLGETQMGQDMLAQDYLLKQLTASMIYPEKGLGKEFWDKVYAKMSIEANGQPISMDAFNKVWIVAERADIFEGKDTAYVTSAHLKVLLEEDYLATKKNVGLKKVKRSDITNTLKQIVLPAIEKEVNEGKNFTQLRQMYHSMILASWYKMRLKNAAMAQIYGNQSKVTTTINANEPKNKEAIFQQYLQAYKKGVFNIIQEEIDPKTYQTVPRKYFSGGLNIDARNVLHVSSNFAMSSLKATGNFVMITSPFRLTLEENLKVSKISANKKIPINRTVLIVESDLKLLEIITAEIESWGYTPIPINALTETVKKVLIMENVQVDLLIAGQNGDEGRASISFSRKQWPHSRVILVHDRVEVAGEEDLSGLYGGNEDERVDKKIDKTRFEEEIPSIKKDVRSLLKPHVLLVTENKVYTTIQTDTLLQNGYDVTVGNYQEAIHALSTDRYDAIVTDLPLAINTLPSEPKIEGLGHKLLGELVSKYPDIPVIYRWPANDLVLHEINHPNLIIVPIEQSLSTAVMNQMPIDAAMAMYTFKNGDSFLMRVAHAVGLVRKSVVKDISFTGKGKVIIVSNDEAIVEKFSKKSRVSKERIEVVKNLDKLMIKLKDVSDRNAGVLVIIYGYYDLGHVNYEHILANHDVIVQRNLNDNFANVWQLNKKEWTIVSVGSVFKYPTVQNVQDPVIVAFKTKFNDFAMLEDDAKGGIDFNTGTLNISKQGDGVSLQFDQRMIDQIKAQGFSGIDFHIERIIPISNLQHILGV